jgi:hypothetical protein
MDTNFDVNQGMDQVNKSKFWRVLAIFIAVAFVVYMFYLSCNGKHNKTPVSETNIPADSSTKVIDTTKRGPTIDSHNQTDDHHTEVNVRDNRGKVDIRLKQKK